jgi:GT2 family glycosyltransferase
MIVWLVISSYRNDEEVLSILEQAHSSEEKPFDRILIVESEGTGVVPAALKDRGWDDVVYRSYDQNLGSGANLCERLRLAAEGGADYAYAINHDGCLDFKVVNSLLRAAEAIENLGAAYPLSYLTEAGRYNVTGTRELPWPAKLVPEAPNGPFLDAFWSSSNGALYSTVPVKRGIVPWSALWMGWEDLEYGWNLFDHGYRQIIVCDAIFRDNYEYAPTKFGNLVQKPAWRTYYHIRNLVLAIRRTRSRPLYYMVGAYRFILECGLILLARKNKWRRLRLACAGAGDGFRGVEGKSQSFDHSIV